MAEDGDKKAKKVLYLSDNFDKTLSAILIGNNVVNIASTSISNYSNSGNNNSCTYIR